MTLVAIIATVALVYAQRESGPGLDTGPATGSTSTPTVLGAVLTRSDLPEAEPARPATLAPSARTTATTVSSPTTTTSKPRSTTTVPAPELIPPVTIENTTTTEPSPTTTVSPTTTTSEP